MTATIGQKTENLFLINQHEKKVGNPFTTDQRLQTGKSGANSIDCEEKSRKAA